MTKKLSNKEIDDIKRLSTEVGTIDQEVGRMESHKMSLLAKRNAKYSELVSLQQKLAKKYGGDGKVNLITGEFEPTPKDA